jgi:PHS family inorganic phosphate transporter-like MFS transporter
VDPYSWITFCRLILGIGVGGVYPLAATVAAESSTNAAKRGSEVSLVFSTQGLGFIACPIVVLIITSLNSGSTGLAGCHRPYCSLGKKAPCVMDNGVDPFKINSWKFQPKHAASGCTHLSDCIKMSDGCNDLNWRMALAFGALPGILMLPFKISETKKGGETLQKSTFWEDISQKQHWPTLIGTAGGWFLFDITFYGNSLFAPTVTKIVFDDPHPTIHAACLHNMALFAVALPGYWLATYYMDTLGRKNIQLLGFGAMAVLYAILGSLLLFEKNGAKSVGAAGMFILYSMTFFFSNFGPNSTTFILPSESFPPDVRGTFNGLSAACGKVGATIGASLFKPAAASLAGGGDKGIGAVLLVCGVISLLGLMLTFIFVEDRRGKEMKGSEKQENLNDPLIDSA